MKQQIRVDVSTHTAGCTIPQCPQCNGDYGTFGVPEVGSGDRIKVPYACEVCDSGEAACKLNLKKELVLEYHKGVTSMHWEVGIVNPFGFE